MRTSDGGFRTDVLGGLLVLAIVVGVGGGAALAELARSPDPSPGSTDTAALPTATATPTPTPTPEPTPTPSPTPEPTPVLVPAPLTGLLVTEAAALQHPVAAMIDDHSGARPQSGFNAAAQVWQAPAEGGIPRYMMIFQDALPASLGPIRSARQYFIDWASELKAMYIHLGGSPQALASLRSGGHGQLVYNADGLRFDGSLMWRIKERAAPHNVYTDAANILKMEAAVGVKGAAGPPVWSFGGPLTAEARPVGTKIVAQYQTETITYRYDPASNTYRRFINASKTQQVDNADGSPVAPANVVILRMAFGALNDGHPDKHRLEAQNIGKGQAIISSNGRVIVGTWKKASATAPTLLLGPDGKAVTLVAGQTFVQVITLTDGWSAVEGTVPGTGLREN